MAKSRYLALETVYIPVLLVIGAGIFHLANGEPFFSPFITGGATAAFILRGMDSLKARIEAMLEQKP